MPIIIWNFRNRFLATIDNLEMLRNKKSSLLTLSYCVFLHSPRDLKIQLFKTILYRIHTDDIEQGRLRSTTLQAGLYRDVNIQKSET